MVPITERRFTSIKALIEKLTLTLAPTSTTILNNPLVTQDQLTTLTITQVSTALTTVSATIAAANANRKYLIIRNTSKTDSTVYIHFGAAPATEANSLPLRKYEYFEFPEDYVYTGEIRAISSGFNNDSVMVLEGV